jgi:hypothetical protein
MLQRFAGLEIFDETVGINKAWENTTKYTNIPTGESLGQCQSKQPVISKFNTTLLGRCVK